MKGAATTIATSSVVPPIRRTTTGMKAMSTVTKMPEQIPLKRSMRKLRRTRAGSQFGSVTARKLTAATAPCHRPAWLGAAFGTRSIAAGPRAVPATGPVATATHAAGPRSEAAGTSGAALAEGPAGAGRRRADDDAAVGLHTHRLGLQAWLTLNGQMHDAAFVGEHRLERHGLAARAHARRDALRDLAQLLLARRR